MLWVRSCTSEHRSSNSLLQLCRFAWPTKIPFFLEKYSMSVFHKALSYLSVNNSTVHPLSLNLIILEHPKNYPLVLHIMIFHLNFAQFQFPLCQYRHSISFLLLINDPLSSTSYYIHIYINDSTLHITIQYTNLHQIIQLYVNRKSVQFFIPGSTNHLRLE